MNECTIYPSINNHDRYAIGSPDGRELERGEAAFGFPASSSTIPMVTTLGQ